ncbi:cory-CC-star protein [Salinisphaera hydrothermalis]|uniref:DNA helicase n=1 Tax=Salinisphaera hydrothermalis (strain C41B8) TaxID=1304275 RepID=A0A084IGT9_SALHC|nr:cory-CC-star protein [Salinisphaera hydrothermalis]KEZ75923.1 hypothetical protein C41B8_17606 [Salinisphaera hydrothermalis C41B8]
MADDKSLWRRINSYHDELFVAPWRASIAREARKEEDVLVALLFLEALGIPGSADYFALELYPDLIEAFHHWHQRMGMETFPEAGVCC